MKDNGKFTRKAVAPIIATLLMVAIAVVGGILIFVFTQGFFADEQVVGPTVDNIRIFGYDTSDDTANQIGGFNSAASIGCNAQVIGSTLANADCFSVFITNLGDKPVAIQAVRVFGTTHTQDSPSDSSECTDGGAGKFNLMTGTTPADDSIIEPNEDATLCISYSGTAVKAGRTIPVQVETSNGQSSQINIINGAVRGQQ